MALKDMLKKVAGAAASGTGRPFEPGKYRLMLEKLFCLEGHKGTTFISEFRVLDSLSTGEVDRKTGRPCMPVAAGSLGSFVVNLSNQNAQGAQFANVKRFILALLNADEGAVSEEDFLETLQDLCGPEGDAAQPRRGQIIELETFKKPKVRKPEEDFTHHRWTYVPQTDEQIAAQRAELDKKK
jgi:hypothetical protein